MKNLTPDIIRDGIGDLFVTDSVAIDAKAADGDGVFSGTAAYYNRYNSNDRRYEPGCFDNSIAKNRIVMLWNHNSSDAIGKWLEFSSNASNVSAKGQIVLGTTLGSDAYQLIKADAVSGLSVGWVPYYNKNGSYRGIEETDRGIIVKEADLIEVSVVSFPAEKRATIRSINSLEDIGTVRELERYLHRQLDLSKEDSKVLISRCMKICDQQRAGGSANNQAGCLGGDKMSGLSAVNIALQEIFKDQAMKEIKNASNTARDN